jgi:hypothetical protein
MGSSIYTHTFLGPGIRMRKDVDAFLHRCIYSHVHRHWSRRAPRFRYRYVYGHGCANAHIRYPKALVQGCALPLFRRKHKCSLNNHPAKSGQKDFASYHETDSSRIVDRIRWSALFGSAQMRLHTKLSHSFRVSREVYVQCNQSHSAVSQLATNSKVHARSSPEGHYNRARILNKLYYLCSNRSEHVVAVATDAMPIIGRNSGLIGSTRLLARSIRLSAWLRGRILSSRCIERVRMVP